MRFVKSINVVGKIFGLKDLFVIEKVVFSFSLLRAVYFSLIGPSEAPPFV